MKESLAWLWKDKDFDKMVDLHYIDAGTPGWHKTPKMPDGTRVKGYSWVNETKTQYKKGKGGFSVPTAEKYEVN